MSCDYLDTLRAEQESLGVLRDDCNAMRGNGYEQYTGSSVSAVYDRSYATLQSSCSQMNCKMFFQEVFLLVKQPRKM